MFSLLCFRILAVVFLYPQCHHATSSPLVPAFWDPTWPCTRCLQSGTLVSILCCWCALSPSSVATENIPDWYQQLDVNYLSTSACPIADADRRRTLPTHERVLSTSACTDAFDVLSADPCSSDAPRVLVPWISWRSSRGPRRFLSDTNFFLRIGRSAQDWEDDNQRELSENS